MSERKKGSVIPLHPQEIDYGRRRVVGAIASLLALGALEEVSNDFKGIKTAGQVATSLSKFIGELGASSEKTFLSPETPIIVMLGNATFDSNVKVRKGAPNIIYEKYDFSVGNHNTEIDLGNVLIENALIMRINPRSITEVVNNTATTKIAYDEWIAFSHKGNISFIKYDDSTKPHIHFDKSIDPSERPQYGYVFDRFEKDSAGSLYVVVKNKQGVEMFASRAMPRVKAEKRN